MLTELSCFVLHTRTFIIFFLAVSLCFVSSISKHFNGVLQHFFPHDKEQCTCARLFAFRVVSLLRIRFVHIRILSTNSSLVHSYIFGTMIIDVFVVVFCVLYVCASVLSECICCSHVSLLFQIRFYTFPFPHTQNLKIPKVDEK